MAPTMHSGRESEEPEVITGDEEVGDEDTNTEENGGGRGENDGHRGGSSESGSSADERVDSDAGSEDGDDDVEMRNASRSDDDSANETTGQRGKKDEFRGRDVHGRASGGRLKQAAGSRSRDERASESEVDKNDAESTSESESESDAKRSPVKRSGGSKSGSRVPKRTAAPARERGGNRGSRGARDDRSKKVSERQIANERRGAKGGRVTRRASRESAPSEESSSGSEEQIFEGVVAHFAVGRTLSENKDVHETIRNNGGEVLLRLTPRVTFLVATDEDYRSCERKVKSAMQANQDIVHPDLFLAAARAGELSKSLIKDYSLPSTRKSKSATGSSRASQRTSTTKSSESKRRGSSRHNTTTSSRAASLSADGRSSESGSNDESRDGEKSDARDDGASDSDGSKKENAEKPANRRSADSRDRRAVKQESEASRRKKPPPVKDEALGSPAKRTKLRSEPSGKSDSGSKREQSSKKAALAPKQEERSESSSGSSSEEEEESVKAETVFKAEVDSAISGAASLEVYTDAASEACYDAYLRLSDLKNNANKFYIIQLLRNIPQRNQFCVWSRWGREGYVGSSQKRQFPSLNHAMQEFKSKFKSKSGNDWKGNASRTLEECKQKAGKYTLLELKPADEVGGDENSPGSANSPEKSPPKYEPCKLKEEVQRIVELICDSKMMEKEMFAMNVDAKKLPLHKLSPKTIMAGYKALKDIERELERSKPRSEKLESLCNVFYTLIPHNVGFQKMSQFIIDSPSKLKSRLEMLDSLSQIERAAKLLESPKPLKEDATGPLEEHPADRWFKELAADFFPVDPSEEVFKLISDYVDNTHGVTHKMWKLGVKSIFEVVRQGEEDRFEKFQDNSNRMLLWHGSRLSNFVGIISQGLRIAPPEAPVSGYMFGKGVYFADMVSKSAQYCHSGGPGWTGLLLLCEVALGESNELTQADFKASDLPEGKLSTKGVGRWAPDPEGTIVIEDDIKVPMGRPIESERTDLSLMYNEHIVYDVDQICIRFLVEMEFNSPEK